MYKWVKRNNGETVRDCHLRNLGLEKNDQYNDWYINSFNGGYEIPGLDGIVSFLEGTPRDTPMVVCGDYDADGVCATVIMVRLLRAMGYFDVSFSIPRRFTDGYGLNDRMIDEIIAGEPGVIVTVDNGITALSSIAKAKDAGWTVIVTDHHMPLTEDGGYTLPAADMVCDPAVHGISYYCGAGIAYKIAEQILGITAAAPLLPYAAIATVADAVELREEGHVYTRRGIQIINNGIMDSPLKDLVEKGVGHDITAEDIAFRIAPLINAVGRLNDDGGEMMADYLLGEGNLTVDDIIQINEERKALSKDACEKAEKYAYGAGGKMLISLIPDAHPGVIGIAAGRLASDHDMPAAVFYVDGEKGMIHGSARGVPGVDIHDIFERCWKKGIITSFGGHAGAAGINMGEGDWVDFLHGLEEILADIEFPEPDMTRYYDLDVVFDEYTVDQIIRTDAVYGPYGNGNDSLVLRIRDYPVPFFKKMGGDGMFITGPVRAVSFSDGERLLDEVRGRNTVDIYGKLSLNTYRGKTAPQIEILDIA